MVNIGYRAGALVKCLWVKTNNQEATSSNPGTG